MLRERVGWGQDRPNFPNEHGTHPVTNQTPDEVEQDDRNLQTNSGRDDGRRHLSQI